MSKIYCTECGAELDDNMKFCSECGTKLNVNSNKKTTESSIKVNQLIKEHNKKSTATKIGLGIVLAVVLLIILSVVCVGVYIMVAPSNNDDVSSENLSPSFTDTIDGITFNIPEGYIATTPFDNVDKGTYIESTHNYASKENGGLYIHVMKSKTSSSVDFSNHAFNDDIDLTINGHQGVYTPSEKAFTYSPDGSTLVLIDGADKQQLESIIIE